MDYNIAPIYNSLFHNYKEKFQLKDNFNFFAPLSPYVAGYKNVKKGMMKPSKVKLGFFLLWV